MFSREQLAKINGASNEFYGWGGEDDDLFNRIKAANMTVTRAPLSQGVFYEENGDHKRDVNPRRYDILARPNIIQVMQQDGLKQVRYTLRKRIDYSSFVWMLFDISLN